MLDHSGLNVPVAPRGWSPRNIDAFIEEMSSSPRAPLPPPYRDKRTTEEKWTKPKMEDSFAVLLQQCSKGDSAGLTGDIHVYVKVHMNKRNGLKVRYAEMFVGEFLVFRTETFEVHIHDESDWLGPVSIIMGGSGPVNLIVETSLHDDDNDDGKNTLEFERATDTCEHITTCNGNVVTKHPSVEPDRPFDIYYTIDNWKMSITLMPCNKNSANYIAMVPYAKASETSDEICKIWKGEMNGLIEDVGDIANVKPKSHGKNSNVQVVKTAADLERLGLVVIQLSECMLSLYSQTHLDADSKQLKMIADEEHDIEDVSNIVRSSGVYGPEAPISIEKNTVSIKEKQWPSVNVVIQNLRAVNESDLSLEIYMEYAVHWKMRHGSASEIATLNQVVLSADSNLNELLSLRHRVCAAISKNSSVQNKEIHTVLTIRGLFHALDAVDYVIREIADYLYGISTRPTFSSHSFLLKEWCAIAHVDNETQALVGGIIENAMRLRHENSVGTRRREIQDQIIRQKFIAKLSDKFLGYSRIRNGVKERLYVPIASESYQQYSSASNKSQLLSVHPTLFTTGAPAASIEEQIVNNLLAGMTNLQMIPVGVYRYTQKTMTDFRKRIAGDSARLSAKDKTTLRLVCGIWKLESPMHDFWENVVSGGHNARLLQHVRHIPDLAKQDHVKLLTVSMGGNDALVTGGYEPHFDKAGLCLLCQFLLTDEKE